MALSAQMIFGQPQKPNLLFIITDQQRYDAVSYAREHSILQTPNMDRIATEGVFFKTPIKV